MSYYQRHVFFCCSQRGAPEKCCDEIVDRRIVAGEIVERPGI